MGVLPVLPPRIIRKSSDSVHYIALCALAAKRQRAVRKVSDTDLTFRSHAINAGVVLFLQERRRGKFKHEYRRASHARQTISPIHGCRRAEYVSPIAPARAKQCPGPLERGRSLR